MSPAMLENGVRFEDFRECLDAFTVRDGRKFWPEKSERLEDLVLLSRRYYPPTLKRFASVTIDDVEAVVRSKNRV